jgi:hypothetical protein
VISRFSDRCPMRVARWRYTSSSAFAERALKKSPPVPLAINCNVPMLGGTRICSVYPPTSFSWTTPFAVPSATVETGTCSFLASFTAAATLVRPPSGAPSERSSTDSGGTTPSMLRCFCPSFAESATASPSAVPSPGARSWIASFTIDRSVVGGTAT